MRIDSQAGDVPVGIPDSVLASAAPLVADVVVPARCDDALVVTASQSRYVKTVWHGESGSVWYIIDTHDNDECVWSGRDPIAAMKMLSHFNSEGG